MNYENQIRQQGAVGGSTFNPRFGTANECAQQGGIVAGQPIPVSVLQEYAQALEARLNSLQNVLYLLSDRLAPVMYPAAPEAASQTNGKDPGAPILVAFDMATVRLTQMQQQVDNLLGRLVI